MRTLESQNLIVSGHVQYCHCGFMSVTALSVSHVGVASILGITMVLQAIAGGLSLAALVGWPYLDVGFGQENC